MFLWLAGLRLALRFFCSQGKGREWGVGKRRKQRPAETPTDSPSSPPALLTLLELHRLCPYVFDSLEVFLDGGIRCGADVLKALCLGATAVGIGRPFLYALSYGQQGVEHSIDVMRDELEVAMRLVGVTDLTQCHPGPVSTLEIDHLVPSTKGIRMRGRGCGGGI